MGRNKQIKVSCCGGFAVKGLPKAFPSESRAAGLENIHAEQHDYRNYAEQHVMMLAVRAVVVVCVLQGRGLRAEASLMGSCHAMLELNIRFSFF